MGSNTVITDCTTKVRCDTKLPVMAGIYITMSLLSSVDVSFVAPSLVPSLVPPLPPVIHHHHYYVYPPIVTPTATPTAAPTARPTDLSGYWPVDHIPDASGHLVHPVHPVHPPSFMDLSGHVHSPLMMIPGWDASYAFHMPSWDVSCVTFDVSNAAFQFHSVLQVWTPHPALVPGQVEPATPRIRRKYTLACDFDDMTP